MKDVEHRETSSAHIWMRNGITQQENAAIFVQIMVHLGTVSCAGVVKSLLCPVSLVSISITSVFEYWQIGK